MAESRFIWPFEPGKVFNPRAAALAAGTAAIAMAEQGRTGLRVRAEVAQAIAAGMVYVGDQIGRLVERDAAAAFQWPPPPGTAPLDALLVGVGEGRARFAIGARIFEVAIGEPFELFIDATGGFNARESAKPYKQALEKIANLTESFGDAPMEDRMRDIAVGALAAGER